jgi:hypothetical protein
VTSASGMRQSLRRLWERTWFTPARPYCLEVGRIILGLVALQRMLWANPWSDDGGLLQLLRLPEGLYTPVSALRLLSLPMPGEAVAKAVWCAAVVSGLLVVAGLKSRWAAASLAIFAGYLKGPTWVLSDNLRNTILMRQFGTPNPDQRPWRCGWSPSPGAGNWPRLPPCSPSSRSS